MWRHCLYASCHCYTLLLFFFPPLFNSRALSLNYLNFKFELFGQSDSAVKITRAHGMNSFLLFVVCVFLEVGLYFTSILLLAYLYLGLIYFSVLVSGTRMYLIDATGYLFVFGCATTLLKMVTCYCTYIHMHIYIYLYILSVIKTYTLTIYTVSVVHIVF